MAQPRDGVDQRQHAGFVRTIGQQCSLTLLANSTWVYG
jgi:hypothetical protein